VFPGEGAYVSFWKLRSDEIFPQLITKEADGKTEQLTEEGVSGVVNGQRFFPTTNGAMGISDDLLVAAGTAQEQRSADTTTFFAGVCVFQPQSVTTTVVGWTDITSSVRLSEKIVVSYGITGSGVRDRVASSGTMTFALSQFETEGQYSPDHASLVTGFEIGAPIRLQVSNTSPTPLSTKFLGRIKNIQVESDSKRRRIVRVTCVDSMGVLIDAHAKGLNVRTNVDADRVVEIAIDQATGLPVTSGWSDSLDATPDTYDFALDNIKDDEVPLTRVIRQAVDSERGYFYPSYQHSGVGADGGFRLESRSTRKTSPVSTTILDEDILESITPRHAIDEVYNRVNVRIFPRAQDAAATTVLFTLQSAIELLPGERTTFTAPYRDPSEQASRVSGTNMQPVEHTTDYLFTGGKDGGGTDLTDNLSVDVEFGGSSAEVMLLNAGPKGFLSTFQLRGKGLYTYDSVTVVARDLTSIVRHGLRDITIELPFVEDVIVAEAVADAVLTHYKDPRTFIKQARFIVADRQTALDLFVDSDIGDKFIVENTVLGIDDGTTSPFTVDSSVTGGADKLALASAVYAIHKVSFEIGETNRTVVTWGLFPASIGL
jgi:hypothetical protein